MARNRKYRKKYRSYRKKYKKTGLKKYRRKYRRYKKRYYNRKGRVEKKWRETFGGVNVTAQTRDYNFLRRLNDKD